MKIAIIGQSVFGAEVYRLLQSQGHNIVGVFTVPDKNGKIDPLVAEAKQDKVPVFQFPRWRVKNQIIPEVFEIYKSVEAELNVMPFCTQFIPMEVIVYPKYQSIIYHPSILPRHRGASAINWTLIHGDAKGGFTIFWADDGLDTGPILMIKDCVIEANDTVETLYNRFLFPEGIKAMAEAVRLIADNQAPRIIQPVEGATYDPIMKKDLAEINWNKSAQEIHNFIRGNDKVPGAWTTIDNKQITMFGSRMWTDSLPSGTSVEITGMSKPGIIHKDGLLLFGNDNKTLNVKQLQIDGKMISAAKFGKSDESQETLELTEEEKNLQNIIKTIWASILSCDDVVDATDFFKAGAGSMDVARLVEEVKEKCNGIELENEDVYMATTFIEFVTTVILKGRGDSGSKVQVHNVVNMHVNNMDISFPYQLFINNEFVDSINGKTFNTINPSDESVICAVSKAGADDVHKAVLAAKAAFEGEWGKMNARDRGKILYRLAELMEEHKEELASIETIDSGAVYTLALKTHIGMSIDTWRYFAGWCDKIQGVTIPINHARPNKNLTFTKREPIGVCGLITPWNYPLMMLSWKMAPCLAAGNTVIIKPAQVTPLTALKFAELTVKAGFPPGVINVLPGSGTECGQALTDHPEIRKIGFTGSTSVGKDIMKCCAVSNIKKVSLELGGKSPLIVFSDCDLDKAVRQGLMSVMFNKGENCIAAGRLFIEESIHDEFVKKIVEEVKKLKIGDPFDRSTVHGPQNHRAHLEKLLEYCEIGVKEGAALVYGGKQVDRPGLFMEPSIFINVEDHMMIAKEESFGPVMVISKFKNGDIDGVLARANNTEYGLASGVFTRDINKALQVSDRLQAGTVFVNTYNKTDVAAPFGGFKQSGFGKDLGEEALNEYLKTKTVTVEY